ncbi:MULTISPECIES: hypothetical protein [unclassified Streptomyces]|uniref:hypothetical protein n=1 Tax=unclassified Streptomyces TaxID=2593676 RepID=UPI002023F84C|nr:MULTISPECIES: hypothetical protein [unclassified Streptomyces]MCX4553918.1 hypothetical protein [Streptomyces sp. NBC_01500]WSC18826.1 hypothetical protein OIE60_03675 [Streptomyces sp. NBC_01766]WSV52862.1 hypothetical protein OG282_03705 [Streptomyces sp. NBC_01014]
MADTRSPGTKSPGTEHSSAEHSSTLVTVELTGSTREDAAAVFGALRKGFACDRPVEDRPQTEIPGRPTVWTASFEVADGAPGRLGTATLKESVEATVQGSYHAVDQLRTALDGTFAVRDLGEAFGDQEKELELRLANR